MSHLKHLLFLTLIHTLAPVFFIFLSLPRLALPHESKISSKIGAGADRFFEYGLDAQFGFGKKFPGYVSVKLSQNSIDPWFENHSTTYGGQTGVELRNWGVHLYGQYTRDELYQSKLMQAGARGDFRMLLWDSLSKEEEILLSDQDKQDLRAERERASKQMAPHANRFSIDYSAIRLTSSLTPDALAGSNASFSFLWHIKPQWSVMPSYATFFYSADPSKNPNTALTLYSSPLIQLAKIGPYYAASRAPGILGNQTQIFTRVETDDDLAFSGAGSRLILTPTARTAWSLWLGIEKTLDQKRHWLLLAHYEHLLLDKKAHSFFGLSLSYSWNHPYSY